MPHRQRLILISAVVALIASVTSLARDERIRRSEPEPAVSWRLTTLQADTEQFPEIIGGTPVESDAFPWVAALVSSRYRDAHHGLICGGTLIAPDWVLTAAHCVHRNGVTVRPEDVDIVLDRLNLQSEAGQRITVRAIEPHPAFNPHTGEFDIALVQLAARTDLQPLLLSFRDPAALVRQGADSLLVGWGTTSWSIGQMGTFPVRLQQAVVPLVDPHHCQQAYRQRANREVFITHNMLCAGTVDQRYDACIGDSGGPLLFRDEITQHWIQLGIVSWGIGCAVPGFYGVYTNIFPFRVWVQTVMSAAGAVTPPPTSSSGTTTPTPASRIRFPFIPAAGAQ